MCVFWFHRTLSMHSSVCVIELIKSWVVPQNKHLFIRWNMRNVIRHLCSHLQILAHVRILTENALLIADGCLIFLRRKVLRRRTASANCTKPLYIIASIIDEQKISNVVLGTQLFNNPDCVDKVLGHNKISKRIQCSPLQKPTPNRTNPSARWFRLYSVYSMFLKVHNTLFVPWKLSSPSFLINERNFIFYTPKLDTSFDVLRGIRIHGARCSLWK